VARDGRPLGRRVDVEFGERRDRWDPNAERYFRPAQTLDSGPPYLAADGSQCVQGRSAE
jgi:hypothetical protein